MGPQRLLSGGRRGLNVSFALSCSWNPEPARRHLEQAADAYREAETQRLAAECELDLADLDLDLDHVSAAADRLSQATALVDPADVGTLGRLTRRLARLARHRGDLDSAIAHATLAAQRTQKAEDRVELARCYLELGHAHLAQGATPSPWIAKAAATLEQLGAAPASPPMLALARLQRADCQSERSKV